MRPSPDEIDALARAHAFPLDTVEIVAKLLEVLVGIRNEPLTRERLALKGGTAINLFVLDVPRLSVDIDLNYVGAAATDELSSERVRIVTTLKQILRAAGVSPVHVTRDEHALTRLVGRFRGGWNQPLTVKVEVLWMFRTPLWETALADSRVLPSVAALGIRLLDRHELIGGKTVALLDRCVPRDYFDFAALLRAGALDSERLRLAVVALSTCTERLDLRRRDTALRLPPRAAMRESFVPVLGTRGPGTEAEWEAWEAGLFAACRDGVARILPVREHEREFLDRLLDYGEVRAELLTTDAALIERLQRHPGIRWRAHHAAKHHSR